MICEVDHIIINLIELRNKQRKNKHQVQILVLWDVLIFTFHHPFKSFVNGFSNVFFDQLSDCALIYLHVCTFYKMLHYNIW